MRDGCDFRSKHRGRTVSPYTPIFRDNFAGHMLASFDNMAGLVASPFRDGPTRGLFSNIVLTQLELQDAKFGLVTAAFSPLLGGATSGTRAVVLGLQEARRLVLRVLSDGYLAIRHPCIAVRSGRELLSKHSADDLACGLG